MGKKCLVIMYGDAFNDPPTRLSAEFFSLQGYEVLIIHSTTSSVSPSKPVANTRAIDARVGLQFSISPVLRKAIRWLSFACEVRRQVLRFRPSVIVTIMFQPLVALPRSSRPRKYRLVSCIYDIPAIEHSGRFDGLIVSRGWKRLKDADLVWSSDRFKAKLTKDLGKLSVFPLICHNCPPQDYFQHDAVGGPRDGQLRLYVANMGAPISPTSGSILLRAGAIGECGGIEETIDAMVELPNNYIFILMGRPTNDYAGKIKLHVSRRGLDSRVILLSQPTDELWKMALLGADIGHLIHGPFITRNLIDLYKLNSSLSNNRLFQYMAAGLPIIGYDDARMDSIYREVACFRIARLSSLVEDIRHHWFELATSKETRLRLGENGRKAHINKYCWEKQFLSVFQAADAAVVS